MEEFHTREVDRRRLDDDLTVLRWRTERLLALGYTRRDAASLASSRVDIHDVERLIARGCPLDTAVRIAALSAAPAADRRSAPPESPDRSSS